MLQISAFFFHSEEIHVLEQDPGSCGPFSRLLWPNSTVINRVQLAAVSDSGDSCPTICWEFINSYFKVLQLWASHWNWTHLKIRSDPFTAENEQRRHEVPCRLKCRRLSRETAIWDVCLDFGVSCVLWLYYSIIICNCCRVCCVYWESGRPVRFFV